VEPHRLALGERQRAVPPAGRRHLALRPGWRPQASLGRGHLRRAAGRREIRARQYHQHWAVPVIGGARDPRRETAADRQGRYRQECRGFCATDPGGARAATPARGDLHLIAVRPRSRVQHLRPAGRLRVSAALGARLSAELSRTRHLAARPVDAVRGDGAADLARHRRSLSPVHRGGRQRQALPRRSRTGGRSRDR